jgi:enoyl-[acyl-carrier-protein] reductase (NADH)
LLWTPLFEHLIDRPHYAEIEALRGLIGRARFERTVEMRIPLKKEQTSEDIGKMAALLASDDARSITRQAINVDGGTFMN